MIPEIMSFQEGPGVRKTQFTENGVKLLNVGNINNNKINLDTTRIHISKEEAFGKYKHFLVDEGDLLIACSGIVVDNFHKKMAYAEKKHLPLCMNTSTMRFKVLDFDKTEIDFYKYYLQTRLFTDQLRKLITGSAQLNFGPSHIKQIEIPLPPLETQQKIAAILDKAQALIDNDKQIHAKYDQLAQSVFLDMFGDPVTNPKGWKVKPLSDLLDFLTSGSRGWAKYYADKGDIFLRIQNVGFNKLKLNNLTYIKTPSTAEAKRTEVKSGDIVMSITADLGRTGVIPEGFPKAHINQHLAIIRLIKGINSIYVSQYISSQGGKYQLMKVDKGGVKAGLNFNDIKSLLIPLPPSDLQNKFEETIEQIEKQKQLTQQSLKKSEELFQSLLQRAFKGELV